MCTSEIRQARPEDYDAIIRVVSDWWGRDMEPGLPRLYLDHFWNTSFVAETEGDLVGFVVGFHSPSQLKEAYVHYVAVGPGHRRVGLAHRLYEVFCRHALDNGRDTVRAITSPANEDSIRFHRRIGFSVVGPVVGYNGAGRDVVLFSRSLP